MKRQENRAVLAWRGAASAGLDSSADRAYMKAPVPRPTLQLVDKVSRSCGHTPGKVAGQRATVKAEMNGFTPGLDLRPLSCYFSGSVATTSGHFVHKSERRTRDGAFIYLPPFSETSPIFCSFPFTKIQPVFLPEQTGRKKHRTPFPPSATPAGITHYTLLRKVVCQMGALPPLETPTRKGGTLPLHGAHTAFSCYPALRLYRLSKSPRGIDVVSLTLGNSFFPFANSLSNNINFYRQFFLRITFCFSNSF